MIWLTQTSEYVENIDTTWSLLSWAQSAPGPNQMPRETRKVKVSMTEPEPSRGSQSIER